MPITFYTTVLPTMTTLEDVEHQLLLLEQEIEQARTSSKDPLLLKESEALCAMLRAFALSPN